MSVKETLHWSEPEQRGGREEEAHENLLDRLSATESRERRMEEEA